MKALPLLIASFAALAPTASHAVVDMGGAPGISDLYELEFNGGELFPEDFDPTLDHDGDGISTLMEYRCFWSDPFDANDRGTTLQLAPFGGGAWQASWQTRQGLQYQLEFSPDLVTWLPAGASVVGTGGIVNRGLDEEGAARIFYRLSCPDASVIDGDDDGVSRPEEGIAGTWDNMERSDPASGMNDIFKAVAIVLAAVAPQAGQDPPVEVGTVVTGLPHTQITEIPQGEALIKGGYFSMPPITDPENWDRFPGAGGYDSFVGWKPYVGNNLELQKGAGEQQAWWGQWCELVAHWQNAARNDHSGDIAHGITQTISNAPAGRWMLLIFDCCRRYEGADTVKVTARIGSPAGECMVLTHTSTGISGDGGWERVVVPIKVTSPLAQVRKLPIRLCFDAGDSVDSYGIFVDNIILEPVDIEVFNEETCEAPADGLVTLKTETLRYRLLRYVWETPVLLADKLQWYWRILKWDGTYSDWTAYQNGQGHTFAAQPITAGIYEVKAKLGDLEFFLERFGDDPHSTKKRGENDCIGIADEQWQINVRNQAKGSLGSGAYAQDVAAGPIFGGIDAGKAKCNLFVADKATDGGAPVPRINGIVGTSFPFANQWSGAVTKPIPAWTLLPRETYPQPGFVVARNNAPNGHCGIIDYDGAWISAGEFNVNRNADIRSPGYNDEDPATPKGPARFRKHTP